MLATKYKLQEEDLLPYTSVSSHYPQFFEGKSASSRSVPILVRPTFNITRVYLTFAISAQLFPASRIVLSLCSSAGVQGVFVRLFLAGGPIDGELMLGSS